jgi:lysophospholipase L1-like esterase
MRDCPRLLNLAPAGLGVFLLSAAPQAVQAPPVPSATPAPRFEVFSERLRVALPRTRLFYVSINRAPEKRDKWDRVDRANQLAREYCAATPLRAYVDVNPALFDSAGEPRLELFQKDRLHLQPAAYDGFAAILKPVLEAAWAEAGGAPN